MPEQNQVNPEFQQNNASLVLLLAKEIISLNEQDKPRRLIPVGLITDPKLTGDYSTCSVIALINKEEPVFLLVGKEYFRTQRGGLPSKTGVGVMTQLITAKILKPDERLKKQLKERMKDQPTLEENNLSNLELEPGGDLTIPLHHELLNNFKYKISFERYVSQGLSIKEDYITSMYDKIWGPKITEPTQK